jgi:hypothetical protein
MTSWKEIAAFLGKSVRTAQRWERELALPVRRPQESDKNNVVIARREELERWVSSQDTRPMVPPGSVVELRVRLASLEAENEELRSAVRGECADLDRQCELLRYAVMRQGSLGEELSRRSGALQARSHQLSSKSRKLRSSS